MPVISACREQWYAKVADYIEAEASDTASTIDAHRRTGVLRWAKPAYGATDEVSAPAELETQRGFEFFLEVKRMGDPARNGPAVLFAPVPNSTYFKPGFSPVGSQTCIPLPITETDNNPNFP